MIYSLESVPILPGKSSFSLLQTILKVPFISAHFIGEGPKAVKLVVEELASVCAGSAFIKIPLQSAKCFLTPPIVPLEEVLSRLLLAQPLYKIVLKVSLIGDPVLEKQTVPLGFIGSNLSLIVISI